MANPFAFINRHKAHLPTIALAVGFIVDIITFRTLNLVYAQMLLGVHLFIVAASIIITSLPTRGEPKGFVGGILSWVPVAQQYSTGNLLSAFLILYSASGSFAASWPFFALVAVAIIGNERLKLQKYRLPFHTSLFFLNLLLFSALAFPLVAEAINIATFLLSVIAATVVFQIFRWLLRFAAKDAFMRNRSTINAWATGVLLTLIVLYFTNLIPPIPLSLKEAGFYHDVGRSGSLYYARDEVRSWFETFFNLSGKSLRLAPGEDAYVFTAVFAPTHIDTGIVHRWERFDESTGKWRTTHTVPFPISGGRETGYRGFSLTQDPEPGRVRVSVETTRGQVIGRTYLRVERVQKPVDTRLTEL